MIDGLRPVLDEIGQQKDCDSHQRPRAGGLARRRGVGPQADFEAWFEAYVKPAFPEGAPMPVIAFDELNDVVTA
jgi:hypothetical protein